MQTHSSHGIAVLRRASARHYLIVGTIDALSCTARNHSVASKALLLTVGFMRFRLHTLMILMAVVPPIIAVLWRMREQIVVPQGVSIVLLRLACLYAVIISALVAYALQNWHIYNTADAVKAENERMSNAVDGLHPSD